MTFGGQVHPATAAPIYSLHQGPLSKERISKGQIELVVKAGDAIIKATCKISDEHGTLFLMIFLTGAKVVGVIYKV